MKKFKKIIAMCLATVMAMSVMCVSAFAAVHVYETGESGFEFKGVINALNEKQIEADSLLNESKEEKPLYVYEAGENGFELKEIIPAEERVSVARGNIGTTYLYNEVKRLPRQRFSIPVNPSNTKIVQGFSTYSGDNCVAVLIEDADTTLTEINVRLHNNTTGADSYFYQRQLYPHDIIIYFTHGNTCDGGNPVNISNSCSYSVYVSTNGNSGNASFSVFTGIRL